MRRIGRINGLIAGMAMLATAGVARAQYPFAMVPKDPPPVISLDFDPANLPDKPGCSVVKAKLKIADKTADFNFVLYLPPGFPKPVGFENGPVPVLVSLHNRAAIGGDMDRVFGESLPTLLGPQDFDGRGAGEKPQRPLTLRKVAPMICIAPHCPDGYGWESPGMAQAVGLLIDAVVTGLHADPDRVCLTGFSYGASSTWVVSQQIPERLAAIAICDGRRTDNPAVTAVKLKHVAIYLTAGDNDGDFTNDARIMSAGLAAGGHPDFVYREWQGGNHFVYGSTYSDPIFWTWLQGQKRAPLEVRQPPPPPSTPPSPSPTPAPTPALAAIVPPTPKVPPIPHLVIDEKNWPTKPGYFPLHGIVQIGDQTRPFYTAIFLPKTFAAQPANLPIVMSLQNRGEHGKNGLAMLLRGEPAATKPAATSPATPDQPNLQQDARFIALIPHCPEGIDWTTPGVPALVGDLIEQTARHYKSSVSDAYLTGVGAGGSAVWSLAAALPNRFAAIAVLDAKSPADPTAVAGALPHTGIYVGVDPSLTANAAPMHEALTKSAHQDLIWAANTKASDPAGAYGDPHFWAWMLSHHKK